MERVLIKKIPPIPDARLLAQVKELYRNYSGLAIAEAIAQVRQLLNQQQAQQVSPTPLDQLRLDPDKLAPGPDKD
jgi:hypothetical protein